MTKKVQGFQKISRNNSSQTQMLLNEVLIIQKKNNSLQLRVQSRNSLHPRVEITPMLTTRTTWFRS